MAGHMAVAAALEVAEEAEVPLIEELKMEDEAPTAEEEEAEDLYTEEEKQEATEVAQELLEKAVVAEPELTAFLQSFESEDAFLEGLEHRIKTQETWCASFSRAQGPWRYRPGRSDPRSTMSFVIR